MPTTVADRSSSSPSLLPCTWLRELGRGRSGVVYLGRDAEGRELACKVFDSHSLTKLVQVLLLGSPNPYMWDEDAVCCAWLRRRILARLVRLWFGERLRVADAVGYGWNGEHSAFELQTLFTRARPVPLHHPLRTRGEGRVRELTREIMAPLQRRLIEAGCDGLVWQAGKGNPVALNNFLEERVEGPDGPCSRWVWIDLESGVPALFPLNPLALLGFYLPRALRWRRPLFDDIDCERLAAHVEAHEAELSILLGPDQLLELRSEVEQLGLHQRRWKGRPRHRRSIGYALARGRLSGERASFYGDRPLRWYAREAWRATRGLARRTLALPGRLWARLTRIPFVPLARGLGSSMVSQRYRARVARLFVARRIRAWRLRGQLAPAQAHYLRGKLEEEESSSYLTDFGVHLAIKPFVKFVEWWLLPVLWGVGLVGDATLAVGLLAGGPIARSLYTLGRLIQSARSGRERPWVALVVGVVPVVGNFAYPIQVLYSSTEREDDLARFILYDGSARLGRHLPIWGGQDTLTEHVFNRLPDGLANLRR